jgi:hypothetical protein
MHKKRTENKAAVANISADKLEFIGLRDCEMILSQLQVELANQDDWSVRASALEKALGLLTNGTLSTDFSPLAVAVANCVTDLRSSLVRSATNFVVSCAQILKERYVTSVKSIVPALFKPLTSGTAILADSCHQALLEIAKHVQDRRTMQAFLSQAASKSKRHRLVVAESLAVVAQEWPESVYSGLAIDVANASRQLADDAAAEVRKVAREIKRGSKIVQDSGFASSKPLSARRAAAPSIEPEPKARSVVRFVEHVEMPEVGPLAKPKSIMKRSPKHVEVKKVEALLLPKSMEQAEEFLQFLTESDPADLVAKLAECENLVAKSVIAAVHHIPQYEDWNSVIPVLLRGFPDVFIGTILDLFQLFRFDPSLVASACDVFTVDRLIERFTTLRSNQQNLAVQFFVALIQSGRDFVVSNELREYLNRIVRNSKNRKSVEPIRNFMTRVANPLREVMDLIDKLQGQGEFGKELAKLHKLPNLHDFEPELEQQLLALLTRGNDAQQMRVICAVTSLPELCFKNMRTSLLGFVAREESPFHNIALACLSAMLHSNRNIASLIESVTNQADVDETTEQAVLSTLLYFVSEATAERVSIALPTFFSYVVGLLECELIPLRRIAVFVLVECKLKLGPEFTKYRKRISTAHQKLIELYIAKRRK